MSEPELSNAAFFFYIATCLSSMTLDTCVYGSPPHLTGESLTQYGTHIFKFICTASEPPFQHFVEFLLDNKTVETVKLTNGHCYHKSGECSIDTCTCAQSGDSFTWYLKNISTIAPVVGCEMTFISRKGLRRRIQTVIRYNGTVFVAVKSINKYIGPQLPQEHNKDDKEDNKYEKQTTNTVTCITDKKDCMFIPHWKEAGIGFIVVLVISIPLHVVMSAYLLVKWCQGKSRSDIGQEQQELEPLIDKTDENMSFTCEKCTLASVVAICSNCKTMFCDICCNTHARSAPNHKICQIDHMGTSNCDVNCKSCKEKIAKNVCMTCITEMCSACCKHHRMANKNHVIKHLVSTKRRDGRRKRAETETEHSPLIKYKYTITMKTEPNCPPSRICGVCFITDGRIVISEYHYKQLQICRTVSLLFTHDLGQEPKGLTSITDNMVAITYPYERQIKLYKINDSSVNEHKTFPLPDKPFSIAYNHPNFAVEMGEGDDGVIAILNETGEILHKISNETSFAYFTGNTIRLALDSNNRKVFVTALSKKSVSCVDYSGNVLWRASVPSPRGLVFLGNSLPERNMIIASKQFNIIFTMNSANGQNDIIMSSGRVKGPRYIDYNLDDNLLCIQVDDGNVLVYEYNITDVFYLRSDSIS